jgi:MFS transporter, FSR family, fosmidomycin resistance protein
MDRDPGARERNMARWTVAGSIGYVAGPVLIAGGAAIGIGWRGVLLLLALAALPLALSARRVPPPAKPHVDEETSSGNRTRAFLSVLRNREVLRWLVLLEAADLLLDIFHGFLALYFVDVAGVGAVEAALAVAIWTGAGFAGDVLLLVVLRRVSGHVYLRASAFAALFVYPAFLAVPSTAAKLGLLALLGLLNSGWYALPKAGLYSALPGRSGTAVAVAGVGGFVGAAVPAVLGFLAQDLGLATTMWILLLAPLALFAGVPSQSERSRHPSDAWPTAHERKQQQ